MALTAKRVEKLTKAGRYGDGHGLYLQVTPAGVRSWLLRYERGGRERWMGLGPLHTFNLDEARARARQARQQLADGVDPLDARKAERAERALEAAKAITFADAARQYFDQHEGKWKNRKHRGQFQATLRDYALPVIGSLPVAAIDTGLVLKCIEPIWQTKTETASRVRGRIEAILDRATVRGYRTGDNPARWKGHLGQVLPARGQIKQVQHHPALPFAEVPEFMAELAEREGMGARALEFLILTAARSGEAIGAKWSEIDLEAKVWTVPTERMKGGREHRVPLSDCAVAILRALPREADFGVSRRPLGHRGLQHGDDRAPEEHGAARRHDPRLPVGVPGLGGRDDQLIQITSSRWRLAMPSATRSRRLSARRLVHQARAPHGRLGEVLHDANRRRQRHAVAICHPDWGKMMRPVLWNLTQTLMWMATRSDDPVARVQSASLFSLFKALADALPDGKSNIKWRAEQRGERPAS